MPKIEHVGVHNFSCVFFFKTWTLGHLVTLKFLYVDLTGCAGTLKGTPNFRLRKEAAACLASSALF
jgi:hypothetical protein